jgi:hypothetical protein
MVALFVFSVIAGITLFVFGYGNADYLNGAGFEYGFGDVIVLATYIVLLSPILIGGGE